MVKVATILMMMYNLGRSLEYEIWKLIYTLIFNEVPTLHCDQSHLENSLLVPTLQNPQLLTHLFPWKLIWHVKASAKVGFLAWTAALGKILTLDNLLKRQVIILD